MQCAKRHHMLWEIDHEGEVEVLEQDGNLVRYMVKRQNTDAR